MGYRMKNEEVNRRVKCERRLDLKKVKKGRRRHARSMKREEPEKKGKNPQKSSFP